VPRQPCKQRALLPIACSLAPRAQMHRVQRMIFISLAERSLLVLFGFILYWPRLRQNPWAGVVRAAVTARVEARAFGGSMAATSGVHALHCHRKHGAILRGKQREPQCCKLRLLPRAFAWVGRAISEIDIRGLAEPHEVRVLSQLPERQSRKHTQEYPSQDTATCRTNQTEQQTLEWNTPHTYCSRRHHRQREQLAVSGPQEVGVIWKGKSEQALVQ
jgi:hypothetical protein